MAKLCSSYGTSPNNSFFNELVPDDFGHIQPDPFDYMEGLPLPSIYGDIQKIESDTFSTTYGSAMDFDLDIKPELRNTDLMWWTADTTNILSTSASSMSSDISTGVSLAAVMDHHHTNGSDGICIKTEKNQNTLQQQQQSPQRPPPTVVMAKKLNPVTFKQEIIDIKQEPTDDVEQQLAHHSIPNNKTTTIPQQKTNSSCTTMQNIPPGTSLLRKSQQLQQQQKKSPQHSRGTLHITKRGDQLLPSANAILNIDSSSSDNNCNNNTSSIFNTTLTSSANTSLIYERPDTPHSLDDDCSTPGFRHNVDLRACVMGSNNISLTANPEVFISNVSQELQDTSKKQINTRLLSNCDLADVLDVINSSTNSQESIINSGNTSMCSSSSDGFSYKRSFESDSDDETNSSLLDHNILRYGAGGVSPVSSQSSNISSGSQHYMQHRDHSYTRCKDGIDDISTNLDTPSDSEEEIDVVSINDKKLPTNPSDKDRRVLQTKVAHKFNAARIVKNPNGIRTIPPRRGSYEFPYTPASSSPVKSVNNSRFPSPANTPYQNQYTTKYVQQQQQQMMTVVVTDSTTGLPINILNSNNADKTRKRLIGNNTAGNTLTGNNSSSNLMASSELSASITSIASMPPTKKHRGKKTKHLVTAVQLPNGVVKRHYSVDETADTIEKRNLHNDMERQRRIGLKNLFEALKKQIPSIKDKERAPKVNILREAAKLCEALTREDQQLMEQKAKLKEELRRNQELLAQLRAHQQID